MQLRPYQEQSVTQVAQKLTKHRKIIFQLATGGGKTITFSAITKRYIEKSGKSVLILVHRKELMVQTVRTLFTAYNISAQMIKAGMKFVPPSNVYVGMVESTIRRIPAHIGLVIIDEAHNLSFAKIHDHFPSQFIIGFTATPLTGSKHKPLKNYYDEIVTGVDIPELIEGGSLVQNITYAPKHSVDAAALKIKNGEYDDKFMGQEFSKAKHIQNTVDAYLKHTPHTKCLIFNCNIAHSELVTQAFQDAGLNCRNVDSTMENRDEIVKWYKETHDAILCNVSILTTGFDAPDTETIIMNRATLSMPLWLQCCGRGSRPYTGKKNFTIIDMGQNAITHGDWCDSRDWGDIFRNPRGPGKPGVAPIRYCPECDGIIAARTLICPLCGHFFPPPEVVEAERMHDFVVITKGIDVPALIAENKERKEYYPFFRIGKELAVAAKKTVPEMNEENFIFILRNYDTLAADWCKEVGKKYNQWHKERAKQTLIEELQKVFKKWQPSAFTKM